MRRMLIQVGTTGAAARAYPAVLARVREGAAEVVLAPAAANVRRPLTDGGDVAELYVALRDAGVAVRLSRNPTDAFEHICRAWRAGDETTVVELDGDTLTVGPSFENPLGRLLEGLPAERRVWIGMGTNTWKSELDLAVRYVRTTGPADAPGATLGIPWMAGIPGTIGGWIKMNAGAFGHSISEALAAVKIDGKWIDAAACGFAYRHSDIEGEIQDYRLKAEFSGGGASKAAAAEFLAKRKRFPAGTFGSFFKNPEGDFAGRILEAAGAKALRVGGAYVWSEHANVIVAGPGATPSDVLALSRLMLAAAYRTSGIWLEPEVRGLFD